MWSYQHTFRGFYEVSARNIYGRLDRDFRPQLFLVGIRSSDSDESYPACVEPEDDFWIRSDEFDSVQKDAEDCYASSDQRAFLVSNQHAAARAFSRDIRESIHDRISGIVNAHANRPAGIRYQVSTPELVGGYAVAIVLGLQNEVIERYPALQSDEIVIHEFAKVRVPTSLIDAVTIAFLDRSAADLNQPDAGQNPRMIDFDDLMRDAARAFVGGIARRIDEDSRGAPDELFRQLNEIASLAYEGADAAGQLVLARRDSTDVDTVVRFEQPVQISAARRSRKLLELAARGMALHCDTDKLHGLLRPRQSSSELIYEVSVRRRSEWQLLHDGRSLLRVSHGMPSLPGDPLDPDRLPRDIPRLFPETTQQQVGHLCDLVRAACTEPHGTMLVITDAAESEVTRLTKQATPIIPCPATVELLQHLTPIDGALILSPDGQCYAIGAILDGMASPDGDPSRGARYNSALRYQRSSQDACLIVVISEDGSVDVIPDMRPAISRRLLESKIDEILQIRQSERIVRADFAELDYWIREHSFYLSTAQCELLNEALQEIDDRIHAESGSSVRISFSPLRPNAAMDEALYFVD